MINLAILILSLLCLIWSATHLVAGATGLAHYYRISPLLIGLTLIAFGISLPEIFLAMKESFENQANLVISNAIGSNIANIGLVLGLTILLQPPKIHSLLFRHGYPILFLIMLLTYTLMLDRYFSVADGCLLLLGAIGLTCYLAYLAKQAMNDCPHIKSFHVARYKRTLRLNAVSLLIGLIMIPIAANYLTNTLVYCAKSLQLSQSTINLTIIALSTSLPQLAVCIVAALKNQGQLAVGIILGSNMFNLLAVLAFPGLINPSVIPPQVIWRDMPMMAALTLIIFLINYNTKRRMIRWHGGLLLVIYGCYVLSLIYNAVV
jgi:cation:H+ antiporter